MEFVKQLDSCRCFYKKCLGVWYFE